MIAYISCTYTDDAWSLGPIFLQNNRLFISSVLKNKAKTVLKRVRIERLTQSVYTGSLFTKSYIQSSEPTENSLSNQNFNYTQYTKVVILNPSRTHTTFGKYNAVLITTSETVQHQLQ